MGACCQGRERGAPGTEKSKPFYDGVWGDEEELDKDGETFKKIQPFNSPNSHLNKNGKPKAASDDEKEIVDNAQEEADTMDLEVVVRKVMPGEEGYEEEKAKGKKKKKKVKKVAKKRDSVVGRKTVGLPNTSKQNPVASREVKNPSRVSIDLSKK